MALAKRATKLIVHRARIAASADATSVESVLYGIYHVSMFQKPFDTAFAARHLLASFSGDEEPFFHVKSSLSLLEDLLHNFISSTQSFIEKSLSRKVARDILALRKKDWCCVKVAMCLFVVEDCQDLPSARRS